MSWEDRMRKLFGQEARSYIPDALIVERGERRIGLEWEQGTVPCVQSLIDDHPLAHTVAAAIVQGGRPCWCGCGRSAAELGFEQ